MFGHNLHLEFVEIRQLLSSGVRAPEVGVPDKSQVLRRHVLLEDERAQTSHLREIRARAPGVSERTGIKRCLEFVARQDRHAIENGQALSERGGEGEHDVVIVDGAQLEGLAFGAHVLRQRTLHAVVVDRLECEQHIRRGEGRAVGKTYATAKGDRPRQSVGCSGPLCGKARHQLCCVRVHAEQGGLRQQRRQTSPRPRLHETVEMGGFCAVTGHQFAAGLRRRIGPGLWGTTLPGKHDHRHT